MLRSGLLETKRAKLMVAVAVTLLLALFVMASEASAATRSLTVQKTGFQTGTVTSSPEGINCGSTCTVSFPEECLVENTHGACISYGPSSVTLMTTVPSGFAPNWQTSCEEGTQTSPTCTVQANNNTVTVHYGDTTDPGVTLTSPTGGLVRGSINLAANAFDAQTGITQVDFLVGGSIVGNDSSAPYSLSYNTTLRPDGPTQVSAMAFNGEGRQATSPSTSITIDNTPPTLTVNTGPNGQTFGAGSTQMWTFSPGDARSGVASVQCSVVPTGSAASFGPCSGGSTSHSVSNQPEGNHTFTVRVRDNGGLETTQSRSFSIDATAPGGTVSINGGAALTNSTSVTLTPSATDQSPGSGVASMRFSNDGVSWSDWEPYATSKSWALASGDGTKTVRAQYRDGVGNVSTTVQDRIKLDTTSPTVETWNPRGNNVLPSAKPTVTFSEKMDEASVVASANGKPTTFVLKKGTTVIPASVTYTESGTTFKAVLVPTKPLKRGATYTATVTTAAKDLAGNALVKKIWKFTVKR